MRRFACINFQITTNADSKLSYTPCYVYDIDMIYQLAKVMEENSSLELEDKDFNIIYEKFVQLLKKHQDKPFEY